MLIERSEGNSPSMRDVTGCRAPNSGLLHRDHTERPIYQNGKG
jgi:hypothetical protein